MQEILTSDMKKMLEFVNTQMTAANMQLDKELSKLPKDTQDALKPLLEKMKDTSADDQSSPLSVLPEIIDIFKNGNNNK